MVSRKELESLIEWADSTEATVTVEREFDGFPKSITVHGMQGVGPFPMAPIYAAEILRERKANHDSAT
jgi:hypothetical protein